VTFFWNGDRYAHRIEQVIGNTTKLFAESFEGSDQDQWPASAPLQQLSIEGRPDNRQVALLVGMAGQSHWSASVTASGNDRSLLFEMACRTSDPSASLSSSYRIRNRARPFAESDHQLRWPHVVLSTSPATIQSDLSEDVLEVRAPKTTIEGVTTVQWAYELRWLGD